MYIEILTTSRSRKDPYRAFRRFLSVRRTGKNMYRVQAEEQQLRKVRRICRRRHYELVRTYPENRGRSDSYRQAFLRHYPRPFGGYRCRYCHRRLSDRKLMIDHIYPVYRAKTGNGFWLRLLGIDDVNDIRNLAPACRRCNTKKGRSAGIWILRAILGKYELYWIVRRLLQAAIILALLLAGQRLLLMVQSGQGLTSIFPMQ